MFLIRRAKPDDVPTLLKLARMVHFINLPPDREIIESKVNWSRQCFLLASEGTLSVASSTAGAPSSGVLASGLRDLTGRSPLFMFVLEQLENNGGCIGTSQIISKMGGPGRPNVSLQLARKEMFSQSLQVGVTHTIATLHLDEAGPTEIGGLILQPSFRGHRQKLGRLLSAIRFHFMALHRDLFGPRVLAEMMGPITPDGYSPFWEHCARCFINLSYEEADKFCQESKEFILTLFPPEPIYLTLLAPEARNAVGQVGPETVPARRMLEKLGFKYHQRIDPFDGGPHLEAMLEEIDLVRTTRLLKLGEPAKASAKPDSGLKSRGYVSTLDDDGEFRAVETAMDLDRKGRLVLPRAVFDALAGEVGMAAGFTPLAPEPAAPATPAPTRKRRAAGGRKA